MKDTYILIKLYSTPVSEDLLQREKKTPAFMFRTSHIFHFISISPEGSTVITCIILLHLLRLILQVSSRNQHVDEASGLNKQPGKILCLFRCFVLF